jgi:taurine dioxygenase
MSTPSITPLDAPLGAEVTGCDITARLDEETFDTLVRALREHLVLAIRGQSLDEDSYLRFGRRWGDPIPHVLDHMRMAGYPEMMTIGNTEERDRDPKIRNGAALWHTDQSYERVPASATMLYSIIAPAHGGETQFCNMRAAYEALDADLRERIDGLQVAHKYGRGRTAPDEPPVNPLINADQDSRVPAIYHPLVLRHPLGGTRALYALGHGAHGIAGMDDDEAEALLEQLKTHCRQERFIYRHKYAVGDVVIWDTLQTMHRATPIDVPRGEDDARLLWRISVRGGDGGALRAPIAA